MRLVPSPHPEAVVLFRLRHGCSPGEELAMSAKYFVNFSEYTGFGQLTVSREEFSGWPKMQFFLPQLGPNQLLDFGEIEKPELAPKPLGKKWFEATRWRFGSRIKPHTAA